LKKSIEQHSQVVRDESREQFRADCPHAAAPNGAAEQSLDATEN
jgi:hypothetical protein